MKTNFFHINTLIPLHHRTIQKMKISLIISNVLLVKHLMDKTKHRLECP